MFLMDPALATDWSAAEAEINRILQRAEAKLLGVKNWGERRLAYPLGQLKRGLYVLSFFQTSPEKIAGLERDVQLSERAVRVLVLRRDEMTPEMIEKALQAEPPPKVPTRGEEWLGRPRGEEWPGRPRGEVGGGPPPSRPRASPVEEMAEERVGRGDSGETKVEPEEGAEESERPGTPENQL
jgi:ribosomal protein S6